VFHKLADHDTALVQMMSLNWLPTLYANFSDHAMAALPYRDTDWAMLLMRPHENSMSAIQAVRLSSCDCLMMYNDHTDASR
jgi:serine protease inhibitor